jgi:hypothetical protein
MQAEAMNDDWRLRATLTSHSRAAELGDLLNSGVDEHDLATTAGERVIVSVDQHELFLYTSTREQAERGAEALTRLATDRGWEITTELRRWHPTAEEWEDPDLPLPTSEAGIAGEHAELIAHERSESASMGFSEYEVRVSCTSHRQTVELAHRLRSEGIPYLRRWRYLLIGAADEESAAAVAERISGETPAGCTVTVEASLAAIDAETPANPFAVFGGLGG